MRDVVELVEGYRRFLDNRYSQEASLYRSLADSGQSPRTMVIACCDSRVDPTAIFNARPGELFVLRNVANLVPPYEPHGDYHGTSAALEFAVTGLNIETIVVMGHARCGGVRAYLDGIYEKTAKNGFIHRWMSLLNVARTEALRSSAKEPIEVQQKSLEHASVRHSIDNLMTFPFIKENIDTGQLRLRGAYFDIADGRLLSLDEDGSTFSPIEFD